MICQTIKWPINKILDLLFGKAEDFDYVSVTSPNPKPNE